MPIIGNAIMVGGGGGSSARLILGAKNEVVTYTGAATGTVTLNANGAGSITLPNGAYQLSGGVSGYMKTLTIDKNTSIIYLRPVKTIYWYGVMVPDVVIRSGSAPTYNDDYFDWTLGCLDTGLSGEGETTCTIYAMPAVGGNTNCYLTYFNATSLPGSSAQRTALYSNTYEYYTLNFTPDTTNTIRINGNAYGSRHIEVKEWYFGDR